jgi:hypothetical protein
MVPPTTRPRGYHAVGSNQFQNSCRSNRFSARRQSVVFLLATTHIETLIHEHLGSSKVEPWIKLVNDTLMPNDSKQPTRDGSGRYNGQDRKSQQCRGVDKRRLADPRNRVGHLCGWGSRGRHCHGETGDGTCRESFVGELLKPNARSRQEMPVDVQIPWW